MTTMLCKKSCEGASSSVAGALIRMMTSHFVALSLKQTKHLVRAIKLTENGSPLLLRLAQKLSLVYLDHRYILEVCMIS